MNNENQSRTDINPSSGALRTTQHNKKFNRRFAVVTIIAFIGIAACLAAVSLFANPFASAKESGIQVKTMPVAVEIAERVKFHDRSREFTGVVKTARASNLTFERTGNVTNVLVDEGQYVKQGVELVQLDTRNLLARKRQLTAQLNSAQQRYKELASGPRQETKDAAKAKVDALTAQKEQAEKDLQRRTELRDSGAISDEEFSRTESNLKTAVANLLAAQKQLDELNEGTRAEQVAAQKSVVDQTQAMLDDVIIEITKSTLLAPFSGRVASRFVDEGETVGPANPVIRLVESDHLEAWIGVPTSVVELLLTENENVNQSKSESTYTTAPLNPAVEEKKSWKIYVAGKPYNGTIKTVLPEVDPATRTRQVIFQVNDNNNDLAPSELSTQGIAPGQIARFKLNFHEPIDGFWIPTAALVPAARGTWSILVAAKSTADDQSNLEWLVVKREVEILSANEERSLVRGTLEQGDLMIVTGVHRIAIGQHVQPDSDPREPSANK